ncbi:MAG: hypothetical protein HYZ60_04445 [Methylocystis sp.]|nr:hypothetical protein [Methylocystis sp.]
MSARIWLFSAVVTVFFVFSAHADEAVFASAAVRGPHSAARLLADGAARAGVYHLGVEVELEPQIITYWRQPGDAGAPPVFDFSRSDNVGEIDVLYPTPKHIVEAGSEVAGYDRRVIFPVHVTPRDPQRPVSLRLAFDYAACGTICLPAKAQLSLLLPMMGDSPFSAAIASAETTVPRKLAESEARRLVAVTRRGGEDDVWIVRYLGSERATDLFAEAPEPFYLESRRGEGDNAFELRLASCCSAVNRPGAALAARVTIATESEALEAQVLLDVSAGATSGRQLKKEGAVFATP